MQFFSRFYGIKTYRNDLLFCAFRVIYSVTKIERKVTHMELKITYELKGQQIRELVQSISEVLNTVAKYRSIPSCAYEIGNLVLDRENSIILNDYMTLVGIDYLVNGDR